MIADGSLPRLVDFLVLVSCGFGMGALSCWLFMDSHKCPHGANNCWQCHWLKRRGFRRDSDGKSMCGTISCAGVGWEAVVSIDRGRPFVRLLDAPWWATATQGGGGAVTGTKHGWFWIAFEQQEPRDFPTLIKCTEDLLLSKARIAGILNTREPHQ